MTREHRPRSWMSGTREALVLETLWHRPGSAARMLVWLAGAGDGSRAEVPHSAVPRMGALVGWLTGLRRARRGRRQ